MSQYIAKKPCSFGGKRFLIGDVIPSDLILPENVSRVVAYGQIAVVEDGIDTSAAESGTEGIVLRVQGDGEEHSVALTNEELQLIFDTLQMSAENAVKSMELFKSEDALILLHATDTRKTVRKAIEARAEALTAEAKTQQSDNSSGADNANSDGEENADKDSETGEGDA